jgi:polysaccharide export outer membrane protein
MMDRRLRGAPLRAAALLVIGWLLAWLCPEPMASAPTVPEKPLSEPDAGDSEAMPSLLPGPSAGLALRSKHLEAAARDADALTLHGYDLAGRGAFFSARAELTAALRLLAQALDEQWQTDRHEAALAAGLAALGEAQDFLAGPSRLEADLDLPAIIAGHRTPVLKHFVAHQRLTPQAAVQSYLTYAQEQLAEAAGEELAGSMAMRGLGKLHALLADGDSATIRAPRPKAMVYYQAALLVCRRNYMAANDLGVLLARAGRYEDARAMLEHSISIHPQSVGWRNLAVVYRQLGRPDLAQQAYRQWTAAVERERAQGVGRSPAARMVQWMDPAGFAQTARQPPPVPQRTPAPRNLGPESTGCLRARQPSPILLCQALGPAAPCPICAVDCSTCNCNWCGRGGWEAARAIAWQAYAQGEYVGHARTAHVPHYRLRVDDQLEMIYRVTRDETSRPYKLNVGDEVRVESFTDPALTRDLIIQPDGTITLRLLGQVRATGKTVSQLCDDLERLYLKYYKVPAITVTPLKVNTKLEDLRATVDRRAGIGGQSQAVRVTPEGTVSLPAIGAVPAQGLTLPELQKEITERYREQIEGIEVMPVLVQRAPRFVYVLGEVRSPGRYELSGPTTVIQAISMAGSWNVGSNLRQVVVFRRGDDWRLLATMVNLQAALYAKGPCPQGEIWLSDSDVVLVPKGRILVADEFIDLVFTRGIYGVFPMVATLNFTKLSSL